MNRMNWVEALAPYVPFFQTLLWVLLAVLGVLVFMKEFRAVLEAVRLRVERGSSLKAGPVELGADLRQLEYVKPAGGSESQPPAAPAPEATESNWAERRNQIYQDTRGVFLAHVLEPSEYPDQRYDIFVYLIRHKSENFDDVDYAEFFFGRFWGNQVFRGEPKDGLIGVRTSAFGTFLCTCRVTFKDGYSVDLHRYIDFEMGRVFNQLPNNELRRMETARGR